MPKFLPIRGRLRVFTNGESAPQMKVWTRGPAWDDLRRWNNRDFDSDFKQAPSACPQSREHQRSSGASRGFKRSLRPPLRSSGSLCPACDIHPVKQTLLGVKVQVDDSIMPPHLPARFVGPAHCHASSWIQPGNFTCRQPPCLGGHAEGGR